MATKFLRFLHLLMVVVCIHSLTFSQFVFATADGPGDFNPDSLENLLPQEKPECGKDCSDPRGCVIIPCPGDKICANNKCVDKKAPEAANAPPVETQCAPGSPCDLAKRNGQPCPNGQCGGAAGGTCPNGQCGGSAGGNSIEDGAVTQAGGTTQATQTGSNRNAATKDYSQNVNMNFSPESLSREMAMFGGSKTFQMCQGLWGSSWEKDTKAYNHFNSTVEQSWGLVSSSNASETPWSKAIDQVNTIVANNDSIKQPGAQFKIYKAAVEYGYKLLSLQRMCGVVHLLTSQSSTEFANPQSKQSYDGRIVCATQGVETQDFVPCANVINVYDMSFLAKKGVEVAQQAHYTGKGIEDQGRMLSDPGNPKTALEIEKNSVNRMKNYAVQNTALYSAIMVLLLTRIRQIPEPPDALKYYQQVFVGTDDKSMHAFGMRNYYEYLQKAGTIVSSGQPMYDGGQSSSIKLPTSEELDQMIVYLKNSLNQSMSFNAHAQIGSGISVQPVGGSGTGSTGFGGGTGGAGGSNFTTGGGAYPYPGGGNQGGSQTYNGPNNSSNFGPSAGFGGKSSGGPSYNGNEAGNVARMFNQENTRQVCVPFKCALDENRRNNKSESSGELYQQITTLIKQTFAGLPYGQSGNRGSGKASPERMQDLAKKDIEKVIRDLRTRLGLGSDVPGDGSNPPRNDYEFNLVIGNLNLFMNTNAKRAAQGAAVEAGAQALGSAVMAALLKKQAGILGDGLADLTEFVPPPIEEQNLSISQCAASPFLPECQMYGPAALRDFSTGGIGVTGSGANTVIDPNAATTNSNGTPLTNGNSGSSLGSLGLGGVGAAGDKGDGNLSGNIPGAATVSSAPPGSGNNGGGGGGSAGGGVAPPSNAGAAGKAPGPNDPGVQGISAAYSGGKLGYTPGSLGKAAANPGALQNPFANLIGKPESGEVLQFRNPANLGKPGDNIFERISQRYNNVQTDGNRLLKYDLVEPNSK